MSAQRNIRGNRENLPDAPHRPQNLSTRIRGAFRGDDRVHGSQVNTQLFRVQRDYHIAEHIRDAHSFSQDHHLQREHVHHRVFAQITQTSESTDLAQTKRARPGPTQHSIRETEGRACQTNLLGRNRHGEPHGLVHRESQALQPPSGRYITELSI